MNLQAAKRAGELAARVDARNDKMALIDQAIAEGWRFTEIRARNMETGQEAMLILGPLDAQTSAAGLAYIKSVYEAELAALTADLDTAETWTP